MGGSSEYTANVLVGEATIQRPRECHQCPDWVLMCAHYDSAWVVLHQVKGDQRSWYVCRGYGPAPHTEHPSKTAGVMHACPTYPVAAAAFIAEEAVLLGRAVSA